MRRLTTVLLGTGLLTALAAPALAHTTANPSTTAAGAFAVVDMRVPHGCDGQATEVLAVQIPAGVVSVKPEDVPGWTAAAEVGEYDEPVTLHGEEITEGVVSVTWTADEGEELADGHFRDFGLSVKFPDAEGETLYFPAVQACIDGSEAAWIEIPSTEGEELDAPAPAVTLTEGLGDGHGAGDKADKADKADETDETDAAVDEASGAADAPTVDAELATSAAGEAEQITDPLVIVALVVGLLGLVAGGTAFAVARRR